MLEHCSSVPEALAEVVRSKPSATAIATLEESVTYAELDERSQAIARDLLARGAAPGRSTALISAGTPYVLAYFGIVRAGNRAVPIEAHFRGDQLRSILQLSQVSSILTEPAHREAVRPLADIPVRLIEEALLAGADRSDKLPAVASDAELSVLFSSGSTGMPKGVVLTHEAGLARAARMARVFGPGKRHLTFTPLAYAYGLIDGVLCPLLHGGQTLILGMYNPVRLKEMVRRFRPGVFLGVPFVYKHLASMRTDLLADFAELRECLFFTTGEPLSLAVAEAFERRYAVPIRQSYGLSEISGISADLFDVVPQRARVGKLIPEVEIRLVEERQPGEFSDAPVGELWVKRSRCFMKCYLAGTESSANRFHFDYYRTGDIARIDESGYLELLGRNDDFVVVSGVRIHPAEIENVLLSVRGVLEAAFVVEKDPAGGPQKTRAYVVLDPQGGPSTEELAEKVKAELPPSRWPQQIEVSAGLPRTDTGKLLRRMLVDRRDERLVASGPVFLEAAGLRRAAKLVDVSRNGMSVVYQRLEASPPMRVGDEIAISTELVKDALFRATCRACFGEGENWRISLALTDGVDRASVEALIAAAHSSPKETA